MGYFENFNHSIQGNEQGPKLVFLHGLMGSAANWRSITSSFVDDYHVLTFDQRGHGRSFQPDHGYTPEDYADDLLKILDELAWEKVILVGHSMGGRNAQNFTARFPERVVKLVVEDIGPSIQEKNADNIRFLLSIVPTPFESKKEARQFFQSGKFEEQIPNNPNRKALSQYFYSNIVETDDGAGDWRFSKDAILESVKQGHQVDRWSDVEALKVPTLVMRGEHSVELTRDDYEGMLKANSNIQGVEIQDSGHWVHFDQRDRFIEELKKFFQANAL